MRRRVRYQVACSLDGYIAGPNGEFDWLVADPQIDFAALYDQFDTLLMGRRTYESLPDGGADLRHLSMVVFSRTLDQRDHPTVRIVSGDLAKEVESLRAQSGKDLWLFGGGELFRAFWELGCIDTVEPAIMPILLGGGVPFLPTPATRGHLRLRRHRVYEQSGIVLLEYDVRRGALVTG